MGIWQENQVGDHFVTSRRRDSSARICNIGHHPRKNIGQCARVRRARATVPWVAGSGRLAACRLSVRPRPRMALLLLQPFSSRLQPGNPRPGRGALRPTPWLGGRWCSMIGRRSPGMLAAGDVRTQSVRRVRGLAMTRPARPDTAAIRMCSRPTKSRGPLPTRLSLPRRAVPRRPALRRCPTSTPLRLAPNSAPKRCIADGGLGHTTVTSSRAAASKAHRWHRPACPR